jgi:hypothetical protein
VSKAADRRMRVKKSRFIIVSPVAVEGFRAIAISV